MGETNLQREIRRRERETRRATGNALLRLREDAGLSQALVARAAGIDRSFLGRIETGERRASIAVLTAVATVLGADLPVRPYPTTGPVIHDRTQAAMTEVLLRSLHPRWIATIEVPVYQPARRRGHRPDRPAGQRRHRDRSPGPAAPARAASPMASREGGVAAVRGPVAFHCPAG
jgi:transcriptional regulator with XRE-family HTH domain